MKTIDEWEADARNMVSTCEKASMNRHPDFVTVISAISMVAKNQLALIDLIREKDEAFKQITKDVLEDTPPMDLVAKYDFIASEALALTDELK